MGEFQNHLDKSIMGPGLSMCFGVKPRKLPVILGVEAKYLQYGHDMRSVYVFIPEFGDVELEIHHRYAIVQVFAFLRFQIKDKGTFQPYVDAMAGLNYLWSQSTIPGGHDSEGDQTDLISQTHLGDTVFAYGIGAGVLIRIGRIRNKITKKWMGEFFIDIGAIYTSANRATYHKEGSIVVEGDSVNFLKYSSNPSLFSFHIGVAASF